MTRGSQASDRRSPSGLRAALLVSVSMAYYALYDEHLVTKSGLYMDELIQVAPVINFLHPERPSPFGHPAHMTMPYIGEIKQVVMLPTIAFLGHGPVAIRTTTIALGLIAVVLSVTVMRRLTPTSVAAPAIAVVLLCVDPSFLFFSRIDYGPNALQFVLKLAGLVLLLRWWRAGNWWALWLAGLAFGVGLSDKANFWWDIGAIMGAAVLVSPRACLRRLRPAPAFTLCTGMVVGALPLIRYNLVGLSFPTLRAARQQTDVAHGLAGRLSQRLHMLESVLTGTWIRGTNGAVVSANPLWRVAAAVIVIALAAALVSKQEDVRSLVRPLGFSVLASLITVLEAVATTGGFAQHHLVLTYPFPQFAVAIATVLLWRAAAHARLARPWRLVGLTAAVALACSLALIDVDTNQVLARGLEHSGGIGNWSNATARLGPTVKALRFTSPVLTADWGISVPLYVYEDGTVPVVDVYPTLQDPSQRDVALAPGLFHPGTLVVTHPVDRTNFPEAREGLFSRLPRSNLTAVLEASIPDGTGHTELQIWRLETASPG